MPTKKKRINLTVPEKTYMRISKIREECGLLSDAAVCIALIHFALMHIKEEDK